MIAQCLLPTTSSLQAHFPDRDWHILPQSCPLPDQIMCFDPEDVHSGEKVELHKLLETFENYISTTGFDAALSRKKIVASVATDIREAERDNLRCTKFIFHW